MPVPGPGQCQMTGAPGQLVFYRNAPGAIVLENNRSQVNHRFTGSKTTLLSCKPGILGHIKIPGSKKPSHFQCTYCSAAKAN
jgi:hypothetical protein